MHIKTYVTEAPINRAKHETIWGSHKSEITGLAQCPSSPCDNCNMERNQVLFLPDPGLVWAKSFPLKGDQTTIAFEH